MRPGEHFTTAVALSGVGLAVTGSAELAAGCFAGAFFIDLDHALDGLRVPGPRRWPRPGQLLGCSLGPRERRLVLPLHSLELVAALVVLSMLWAPPALIGAILGGLLHLALDIVTNGERRLRRPLLFYSLAYRARLGFSPDRLLTPDALAAGPGPSGSRHVVARPPGAHLVRSCQAPAPLTAGGETAGGRRGAGRAAPGSDRTGRRSPRGIDAPWSAAAGRRRHPHPDCR